MADKKDVQFEEVQANDPGEKVISRAIGFWGKIQQAHYLRGYFSYCSAWRILRLRKFL